MKSLPASGKLSETPLPALLLELSSTRFTGSLSLSRERTTKRVLWRDGAPILGESNLASETLGVTLLDSGKLTREDYAKVVGYVQLKSCKEGKALLDLKLLEPKGLFVALKEQLRRRILECFGWPDGAWSLDPKQVPPADAQAFRLDPRVLAQVGIESHWSPERVLGSLGKRLGQTVRATESGELLAGRLRPSPGVAEFLAGLDGSCTLGEAIRRAGAPGALAAAWVLEASGLLSYPDPADKGSKSVAKAGDPEDSELDIEIMVSGGGSAPRTRPEAQAASPRRMRRCERKSRRNTPTSISTTTPSSAYAGKRTLETSSARTSAPPSDCTPTPSRAPVWRPCANPRTSCLHASPRPTRCSRIPKRAGTTTVTRPGARRGRRNESPRRRRSIARARSWCERAHFKTRSNISGRPWSSGRRRRSTTLRWPGRSTRRGNPNPSRPESISR